MGCTRWLSRVRRPRWKALPAKPHPAAAHADCEDDPAPGRRSSQNCKSLALTGQTRTALVAVDDLGQHPSPASPALKFGACGAPLRGPWGLTGGLGRDGPFMPSAQKELAFCPAIRRPDHRPLRALGSLDRSREVWRSPSRPGRRKRDKMTVLPECQARLFRSEPYWRKPGRSSLLVCQLTSAQLRSGTSAFIVC